jgi:YidC/Oxa1 family membrane protein insertase
VAPCKTEENAPRWETDNYVATFSRCGGTIASWELKGSQYRKKVEGKDVPIDLARSWDIDKPEWYSLQTQVTYLESDGTRADAKRTPVIPPTAQWQRIPSDKDVIYEWTAPDGSLAVTKVFRQTFTRYGAELEVRVENRSDDPKFRPLAEVGAAMYGWQNPNAKEQGMFSYAPPQWGTACYAEGDVKGNSVKGLRDGAKLARGDVRWVGLAHKYFLFVEIPNQQETLACERGLPDAVNQPGLMKTTLTFPQWTLEKGKPFVRSVVLYAGPKKLEELEATNKITAHKASSLEAAVDLGWFSIIARPMLWLLKVFHGWVQNWGLAIILLTITVKLLTLYWTQKSMRSMKAMSKLKPKMDEIREKYPDDKQRLLADAAADAGLVRPVRHARRGGGAVPGAVHPPVDRRPDGARSLLHPAGDAHRAHVPAVAHHAGGGGLDAAEDDDVRHAADVRRVLAVLPVGADDLHLHEHVAQHGASVLHEPHRQGEGGRQGASAGGGRGRRGGERTQEDGEGLDGRRRGRKGIDHGGLRQRERDARGDPRAHGDRCRRRDEGG